MPVKPHMDIISNRHATWLELFYDLIFVIAVSRLTGLLEDGVTFTAVWHYAALYFPVFWCWITHTVFSTRFDSDDTYHRLMTFIMLFAAIIMAEAIPHAFTTHARIFAIGFILSQAAMTALNVRAFIEAPKLRRVVGTYTIVFGVGNVFWLVSLFVDKPLMFHLWFIGMLFNLAAPWLIRPMLQKRFPLDASHLPERVALFLVIMLGEVVAGVMHGIVSMHWTTPAIIAAVLSFILAINIWWQYFCYLEAVDHSAFLGSGQPYIYAHTFMFLALGALGAGITLMIHGVAKQDVSHSVIVLVMGAMFLWVFCFSLLQNMGVGRCVARRYNRYGMWVLLACLLLSLLPHFPAIPLLIIVNLLMGVVAFGHKKACY